MTKTVRHVGMVLMNAVAANRLPTHFQSKAEPIGHDRPMVCAPTTTQGTHLMESDIENSVNVMINEKISYDA